MILNHYKTLKVLLLWCFPNDVDLLIKAWHGVDIGKQHSRVWRMTLMAIWWTVWTERNNRCFQNKARDPHFLSSLIKCTVADWATHLDGINVDFLSV